MNAVARSIGAWVLALLAASAVASPRAAQVDDMVAFDAAYIPALALSSSAAQDAAMGPKAQATIGALRRQWPALEQRLATSWGAKSPDGWLRVLDRVERQIESATVHARRSEWSQAHEALEPVRIELMKVRQQQGLDYFVDRLTAFHEPMERLAIAGTTWQPAQLDATRRGELEREYAHARALWYGIEQQRVDARTYGLTTAREQQLHQAIDEVSQALSRLSLALRGNDNERLLKAAAALKRPFARAFTAFGQTP